MPADQQKKKRQRLKRKALEQAALNSPVLLPEILVKVLIHLRFEELLHLQRVCRTWKTTIGRKELDSRMFRVRQGSDKAGGIPMGNTEGRETEEVEGEGEKQHGGVNEGSELVFTNKSDQNKAATKKEVSEDDSDPYQWLMERFRPGPPTKLRLHPALNDRRSATGNTCFYFNPKINGDVHLMYCSEDCDEDEVAQCYTLKELGILDHALTDPPVDQVGINVWSTGLVCKPLKGVNGVVTVRQVVEFMQDWCTWDLNGGEIMVWEDIAANVGDSRYTFEDIMCGMARPTQWDFLDPQGALAMCGFTVGRMGDLLVLRPEVESIR